MRLFMGKAEREISNEVWGAHGGSKEQYRRVIETLQYVGPVRKAQVHFLIQDIFLNQKVPWKSERRAAALVELTDIIGGFPHAYQALLNYWPVAKSIRMTGWESPE